MWFSQFSKLLAYVWSSTKLYFSPAKLPLTKVRQMYFKLKNTVFAKARFGVVYSARELEKILVDSFGEIRLPQVTKPK